MPPRTRAEVESELAQDALRRGQELLDAGDAGAALHWLERACRIAPDNDTALLPLAVAVFTLGDSRAAELFASLAGRHDVREVWIGLAAARLRIGDAPGAASALSASLRGHALPSDPAGFGLADEIVARAGAAGWCGVRSDGIVVARGGAGGGPISIAADGAAIRGRRLPPGARELRATIAGRDLLGSPVEVTRIRRLEGFVACEGGGIAGWAWHPGDAGRDPVVLIENARGTAAARRIVARDLEVASPPPLTRPRGFAVPASELAGAAGPIRVVGLDGRDLMGSPLDPGQEARSAAASASAVARALPLTGRTARDAPFVPIHANVVARPATAPRRPRRPVAVVVPVYRDAETTLACLQAVFETVPRGTRIVVIDDASPEPTLSARLELLARQGRILLRRHARNLGFPAAANAGLRLAALLPGAPDLVLLNSDTLPAPGWIATLRAAVHASADIGTAAPLSNDASILGYPDPAKPGAVPDAPARAAFAGLAGHVHGMTAIDIPTSVGFCMYIRRECLVATGLFRTDVFGQGYGEENDFCLRAKALGWRHVAAPGAYVAHLGGRSFGEARADLLARNLDVLERLHPGYRDLVRSWQTADPLAPARRALDIGRWPARPLDEKPGRPVIIVTHDSGGGVERAVRERCAALAAEGRATIVLRPVLDRSGEAAALDRRYVPGLCLVGDGSGGDFPNLRFQLPAELPALAALLRDERPEWLEAHHLLGHDHSVIELAKALRIPYEARVHDYAWICPRIHLVGIDRRYCGEPDVAACVTCVADAGSELEEAIDPAALRRRSAADLGAARRVIAPSRDAAARLRRHFPGIEVAVVPHEDDSALPPLRDIPPGPRRVAVIGAIGIAKGYEALLASARDAAARDLALSFIVIGHTEDDSRLLDTGRVFVTGPYRQGDAAAQIGRQAADLAWLPSVWPETWCYALSEAMRAGLPVVAFDLGAQAERLRATGRGVLLPLGLPAASVNNALLALRIHASEN